MIERSTIFIGIIFAIDITNTKIDDEFNPKRHKNRKLCLGKKNPKISAEDDTIVIQLIILFIWIS